MDALALVPAAVGIALSPLPAASVVFLLGHRRGPGSAVGLAAGWTATIAVGLAVAVLLGERLPPETSGGTTVEAVIALCAAVLLFALAVWQWVRRRLPDGSPASSRWADRVDAIGSAHAVGLGALLTVNPKVVVLVLSAGLVFGEADPAAGWTVLAGVCFVLVAALPTVLPIGIALALGRRAQPVLDTLREWIARWGSLSLVVVLVVLGTVQLVTGLAGLR